MTPAAHAERALTGVGAASRGGRWNSKGIPAVYASIDAATTVLETLTTFDPEDAPVGGFRLLKLQLPDGAIIWKPASEALPEYWNSAEKILESQRFGDSFLGSKRALAMMVPSAVLEESSNVVINPAHELAGAIKIVGAREFSFDPRWPLSHR